MGWTGPHRGKGDALRCSGPRVALGPTISSDAKDMEIKLQLGLLPPLGLGSWDVVCAGTLGKRLWFGTWFSGALLIACQRTELPIPSLPLASPIQAGSRKAFVPCSPTCPQKKMMLDTS